ncbi:LysE family translocator [Nesterenkonia sp. NBAIMH1]|uniref:LysE family translocator n=1 Tax=Nesterenkonia sp. NBAIMH1 TaxID=2600320 RepID=UPI00143DB0D6|nr:LysE family translocator [Nesterenkonia sp. NBAIMH1]
MNLASYAGLLAAAFVVAVTPGPDTMLSLRCALSSRRAGVGAATGSCTAIFLWAALTASGLAAVFQASPVAYDILRTVGGSYLLFLATRAIITARRRMNAPLLQAVGAGGPGLSPDAARVVEEGAQKPPTLRSGFFAGLATCMTNPKVALFFLALFPQFMPEDGTLLFAVVVMGGTVACTMYAYLIGVVLLVDAANRWLSNPRVTGWIEMVSGLILLALGAYMAVSGTLALLL